MKPLREVTSRPREERLDVLYASHRWIEAQRFCQEGGRFSPKARTPSAKSAEVKHALRRATSSASSVGSRRQRSARSERITRLFPESDSGALPAISAARSSERASRSSAAHTSLTSP